MFNYAYGHSKGLNLSKTVIVIYFLPSFVEKEIAFLRESYCFKVKSFRDDLCSPSSVQLIKGKDMGLELFF